MRASMKIRVGLHRPTDHATPKRRHGMNICHWEQGFVRGCSIAMAKWFWNYSSFRWSKRVQHTPTGRNCSRPPHIRRTVASRVERQRQTTQFCHQLYDHVPSAGRLKPRNCFMRTVTPLDSPPTYTRVQMWNNQLTDARATVKLGLEAAEALPGLTNRGSAGIR